MGAGARQLETGDAQGAVAAGNVDPVPVPLYYGAGESVAGGNQGLGFVNPDALVTQIGVGSGPGVKGANQPFNRYGICGPVNMAFSLAQFAGVAGQLVVLEFPGEFALLKKLQGRG